jgi:hypothetical protein
MNAMDKALATRLMDEILAAEPNLESLSILCARDEWRGLRRQIGMVMSSYVYMTMAIVRQFPDLDPIGVTPGCARQNPPQDRMPWRLARCFERRGPIWTK